MYKSFQHFLIFYVKNQHFYYVTTNKCCFSDQHPILSSSNKQNPFYSKALSIQLHLYIEGKS